eukprot:CAMPEP_0114123252 /NCGR_PEP_ID=MMETSP0043_2-20121206/8123_1 /TAXON_ID=464988 /ORGANISM="Hemiselmis andersenii, Strain CCMP644" /LENGTH=120 /DNA_ID=CAMNT_0001216009 /DNA_START=77 /DNA_END=439 /DNA_ORIENTATION=+
MPFLTCSLSLTSLAQLICSSTSGFHMPSPGRPPFLVARKPGAPDPPTLPPIRKGPEAGTSGALTLDFFLSILKNPSAWLSLGTEGCARRSGAEAAAPAFAREASDGTRRTSLKKRELLFL